jgi:hypothetical protein
MSDKVLAVAILRIFIAACVILLTAGLRGVIELSWRNLASAFVFVTLVAIVGVGTRTLLHRLGVRAEEPRHLALQIFTGLFAFVVGWSGFTQQMVLWSWSELSVVGICCGAIAMVIWLADRQRIKSDRSS